MASRFILPTYSSCLLAHNHTFLKLAKRPKITSPMNGVIVSSHTPNLGATVNPVIIRRSANYKPNIWNFDDLLSLNSTYTDDDEYYKRNVQVLKENVRKLLIETTSTVQIFDLIDAIQRLGLRSYYKDEIKEALDNAFINMKQWVAKDLYLTSLGFRLLRQHGYHVHQGMFEDFKDENGGFKFHLGEDVKGILSLYEASYFGVENEAILDEAKSFSRKHLKGFKEMETTLGKKVSHSLELPLHWRTSKLESRWYIDVYESEDNAVPLLLDLAKLEYNIVQAKYQREVRILTRWWVDLGLQEKMDFYRDRILEHYFWSFEMIPDPQYDSARIGLTKLTTLITVIDDIYDVYGSLEELLHFTDAVERWEVSAMEQLPHYMKVVYMALLNTNNQIGYEILKRTGVDITSNQKKTWVDLCKAYLLEAKWYYGGDMPPLQEYLDNAVMSIAAPLMLMTSYYSTTEEITKEALDCIESMPSIIYNSAMILRLANDLGTSPDEIARGDVPKSIQCYMKEEGVSEEVAREHINYLITEAWKKMNKAAVDKYPFSQLLVRMAQNLARQAQCVYLYGDGQGIPDQETKAHLTLLVIEPIPLRIK